MRISFAPSTRTEPSALAVFAAKDGVLSRAAQAIDAKSGGQLTRAMRATRFEGEVGQVVELLAPSGVEASRVLLVGTGPAGKADRGAFERIGGTLATRLLTSGEVVLTIDMEGVDDIAVSREEAAARIGHGVLLRSYRFDRYRTKQSASQRPTLSDVSILNAPAGAEAAFERLLPVAEAVFYTRDLVTEPANVLYPESFAERVKELSQLGVDVEVLTPADMEKLGMGALLGVAQGSARPARLLVMRWDGTVGSADKPVVLVGKGVTFDTGGISIKPAAGMEDMKWDMGGAAAVVGTMRALAARKAKAYVIGVCGLVENMPSGTAQRPGDVVTSMSGQTIEVINTDAEGRLVLCDAIWYAQDRFKPEVIVDLATLTGAMIISLGHEYAGLFSNDDELARQLVSAGLSTGDRLWRFPLGEAYDKLIESPIADMKNVGPREAGSVTAAQFLQRFIKEGVKWAHLDIAGTVWASKPGALWDKGATGYGVRLLDRFIEDNYEQR